MAKLSVLFLFPWWAVWVGWRNRIDLIIAFGALYAFIQALSKNILKRPMVTFIRGNMSFGSKMQNSSKCVLGVIKMIEGIGIRCSNRIITNNEASRSEILNSMGRRKNIDVHVLYNNIPPISIRDPEDIPHIRAKYGIPKDARVLVTAGIINRGKNIETLIRCLHKQGAQNIYLMIVGESFTQAALDYKEFLQGLTRELQIAPKVIFTGWLEREELYKIYLASDLFVMSSMSEGMPNAMLEALGSDLPCIGSDISGIKDILQHDELLFDPFNDNSLADKIQKLLYDPVNLDKIKTLCWNRKKDFIFNWKERLYQLIG